MVATGRPVAGGSARPSDAGEPPTWPRRLRSRYRATSEACTRRHLVHRQPRLHPELVPHGWGSFAKVVIARHYAGLIEPWSRCTDTPTPRPHRPVRAEIRRLYDRT